MESLVIEQYYPITFRQKDAENLGKHLADRHSVVLIGMKRVGISNFLRFFLYHKSIAETFIKDGEKHLFVPVDLNDLVEREVFPFWTLTFKRVIDSIEKSAINKETKEYAQNLFLNTIQSRDLFLTIDGIRRVLLKIIGAGFIPTIFFVRFDRLKDVVTPEFFNNLQGLKDAAHGKLSYVFTSERDLNTLAPSVFAKASLSVFSNDIYIKPAGREDIEIIFQTFKRKYKLNLSPSVEEKLFELVDGYVQYLHLALIALNENKGLIKSGLFNSLIHDERIILQSEELWESLTRDEKNALLKILKGEKLMPDNKKKGAYLWDTGFLIKKGSNFVIFSPLFENYLKGIQEKERGDGQIVEFTKKENLLFNLLMQNAQGICEREKIIERVWPEVEALGVSDWAIDRLVARVRNKLKLLKSKYEIQTVKTRGYKLIESAS